MRLTNSRRSKGIGPRRPNREHVRIFEGFRTGWRIMSANMKNFMKLSKFVPVVLLTGFLAVPLARAAGDQPAQPASALAGAAALTEPVKAVLTNYFKIHAALAADSTKGVSASASALGQSDHRRHVKRVPCGHRQAGREPGRRRTWLPRAKRSSRSVRP